MQKTFIEASAFTEWISEFLSDDEYAAVQDELLANPDKGDVIPGCGGLRKLRTAAPKRGKGKRGGARIIYLHVPEVNQIFLLDIYGKDEKDDLNAAEKRELKRLADALKEQARSKRKTKRGD